MSVKGQRLRIVLCWHMHQPYYGDPATEQFALPWAYLHAIKDYADMAWYLETEPRARAVVNFTPTLLEQLEDYELNLKAHLKSSSKLFGGTVRLKDPLLAVLVKEKIKPIEEREGLIRACLRANQPRLIDRYPPYKHMAEFGRSLLVSPPNLAYVADQYFFDLCVWYHIAWLGESVKRSDPFIKRLIEKASGFEVQERLDLLRVIYKTISSIVPRYRNLHQAGRVELSVTPYAHPIMPLLFDLHSAREAWPGVSLPAENYPGGEERVLWHTERGLAVFERFFRFRPVGCWPAEGSVCDKTLEHLADAGFKWAATGENVLKNSLRLELNKQIDREYSAHRAFSFRNRIACFFRDDGLSDEIGFNYTNWHADDAVANLVHHLEVIQKSQDPTTDALVSIILDGENAWEYYPENGYFFLSALYKRLADHPALKLTTFSECLAENIQTLTLQKIVAGSWVYGSFSTWIGHKDKNRAWDLLIRAKKAYDHARLQKKWTRLELQKLERQLAICEGSDWFWWFGDDNPGWSVRDFDVLYRAQLKELYRLMGQEIPADLDTPISGGGSGALQGGVMKPGRINFGA